MITVSCSNCQAAFNLKDELAGKNGKCPNCQTIFLISSSSAMPQSETLVNTTSAIEATQNSSYSEATPVTNSQSVQTAYEQGVFKNHSYGIKQKKIAINEKYFIKDAENQDMLFSIRRIYFWKRLGAIILGIIVFLLVIGTLSVYPVPYGLEIVLSLVAGATVLIYFSPKRHIEFYFSEVDLKNKDPIFSVTQDGKIEFPTQHYTLTDSSGKTLAKFRKNIFTNILRRTWHIEFEGKHIIVKEDSIILGLLRRLLPFGHFIRTNFIFIDVTRDPKSTQIIGYFKRKFEIFDNYTLDLINDPAYILPRQIALSATILLDSGEKR